MLRSEKHWHDYEGHTRAVRSKQFKYIRNSYSDLPNTPPADAGRSLTFQAMQRLRDQKKLTNAQMAVFLELRPVEEFYDTETDPFELKNVATDPAYSEPLAEHRQALKEWAERTNDYLPFKRRPDEFDRETGEPTPARKRPRPSKMDMSGKHGPY